MKIITTPAKKMTNDISYLTPASLPVFLDVTREILKHLKTLNVDQIKKMLCCNDSIAQAAYWNYQTMDLTRNTVPAILSYQGIQYDYLQADLLDFDDFDFLNEHLVILSGFYGVLKPLDGVVPYRLELNNYFNNGKYRSLYQLWDNRIYLELIKDDHNILDLGAKQYSKIIQKYLSDDINYVKCYFKQWYQNELKEVGVYVKMARGAMTRYLIKNKINCLEQVKNFNELGYQFAADLSNNQAYVFVKKYK